MKKNVKKYGVMIIAAVLLVTLAFAGAASAAETHEHNGIVFEPFPDDYTGGYINNSYPGVYNFYLTHDTHLMSDEFRVADNQTVNLCLNGYRLSSYDTVVGVSFPNATLNIYDCKGDTGTITTTGAVFSGGGIWISNKGTVNMYGGSISGNNCHVKGAGVVVGYGGSDAGSTFNMYGGKISNNTARDTGTISWTIEGEGGGVFVDYGEFNLYGGEISGNYATNGAGIMVDGNGVVNMYGGIIRDNIATNSGGGICHWSNAGYNFNMYGGIISNNTAEMDGGGCYVKAATFNLYNGDITKNLAKGNGGGVGINANRYFNMVGGNITDNVALCNGGGIYNLNEVKISGGLISGNTAKAKGSGIYHQGTLLKIQHGSSISVNDDVYLCNGKTLDIPSDITIGDNFYLPQINLAQYGNLTNVLTNNSAVLSSGIPESVVSSKFIFNATEPYHSLYKYNVDNVGNTDGRMVEIVPGSLYLKNVTIIPDTFTYYDDVTASPVISVYNNSNVLLTPTAENYTMSGTTSAENAGVFTITVQNGTAYGSETLTAKWQISPQQVSKPNVTYTYGTSFVYDGTPKIIAITQIMNKTTDGVLIDSSQYDLSGVTEATDSDYESPNYAYITFKNNYQGLIIVHWNIAKAIPNETYFVPVSQTAYYDGNNHSVTPVVAAPYTGMGEMTVTYYNESGGVEQPNAIGVYTVNVSTADGVNFQASAGEFTIGTLTIVSKPQYTPSSSSKQTGSTVILQEGQTTPTAYATATPTVAPTAEPTPATPTVIATEKPTTQATQQSPAPVFGIIAGLGVAAVLLRQRK